jgi:formate dehydrogenase (coenzyme F420) beta subunit
MKTSIPVENGNTLAALQSFLKELLEAGVVEALLVPMRTSRGTLAPALVSNPELLAVADPLAPVMPVSTATLAGKLSVREPRPKAGAVMRSCELRAFVELVKMQQGSPKDLLLIAVDCAGTYSVTQHQKKSGNGHTGEALWPALIKQAAENPAEVDADLRSACKICEKPTYSEAQITIELFGSDLDREIRLTLPDELGEKLELTPAEGGQREEVVRRLVEARIARRDAEFAAVRSQLEGEAGIMDVFASCIRCHNCMTVCPICYCKTCVFKSSLYDHEPMQFMGWARQKGALRMPADTTLFHMTRLNHMALSCVGCGMCTEACPAELPVGMVFRAIGQRVQQTFEYGPGRSLEEPLPLVTFKADEWTEVGE